MHACTPAFYFQNRAPDGSITMPNENDQGFPAFVVIFLLCLVWMLTKFSVFICVVVMVLLAKVATPKNSDEPIRRSSSIAGGESFESSTAAHLGFPSADRG